MAVDSLKYDGVRCRTVSGWKHSSTKAILAGVIILRSRSGGQNQFQCISIGSGTVFILKTKILPDFMDENIEKLQQLADFFKRVNKKILLLGLINKAKSEYDKCDFETGRESLEQAYELAPDNHVVLRGLGCLEQFEGKYESALDYFNRALEKSTDKEIEYTLIGMVYYLQDKLDEAVKYFNLAIDENDDYSEAYNRRNQAMLENHLKIVDLQESLKKYF